MATDLEPIITCHELHLEMPIVDEAERLSVTALEFIRYIFDRRGVGVILIGMPGMEKRLSRYPQLYSRVGFAHHYRSLQGDELSFVQTRHCRKLGLTPDDAAFTDTQAIASIARITGGPADKFPRPALRESPPAFLPEQGGFRRRPTCGGRLKKARHFSLKVTRKQRAWHVADVCRKMSGLARLVGNCFK